MTAAETARSAKLAAATRAADLVESGMIVGLGSGSTASLFITALGARVRDGLSITGVPTSAEASRLAAEAGIPLADRSQAPPLDVDIDGADEIDPHLNLIKGHGGALLHEKLVALSASRMIVIGDETKLVDRLGRGAIPVEVVSFYEESTRR